MLSDLFEETEILRSRSVAVSTERDAFAPSVEMLPLLLLGLLGYGVFWLAQQVSSLVQTNPVLQLALFLVVVVPFVDFVVVPYLIKL